MIEIQDMTPEEVLQTMTTVINRIAPKYAFYGYPTDDIKQESYIICIEALNRYKPGNPLENFLSANLANRLKNFIRDNHFVADTNSDRVRVMQPVQLTYEETLVDTHKKYSIDEDKIDKETCKSYIDRFLPADMRMDYLKILSNIYITKTRKDEVMCKVKELIQEFGYEKG